MQEAIADLGIIAGWIAVMSVTTRFYLRAVRNKRRVDAWIWFLVWCNCLVLLEWPVYAAYRLLAGQ